MGNLASMVLAESLVITHLVPFVTLGGSKEHKLIIGTASFNVSKCEGNPDTSKEFKNSMGKCTAWDSSRTESSNQLICTQQAHQVTVLPRQC